MKKKIDMRTKAGRKLKAKRQAPAVGYTEEWAENPVPEGGTGLHGKYVPLIFDPVTSPNHYTQGGVETIDFIRAKLSPEEYKGYLRGNILKYTSRAELKGGAEDYRKAKVYMDWLLEVV